MGSGVVLLGAAGSRRLLGVLGVLGALALLAGCATGPATTPTPTASPAGGSPTTIRVGDRAVLLYEPTRRQAEPTALVVALHGYTGDAAGVVEFLGLRREASDRGFLVAAPQGTVDPEGRTFWNASRACCNFHGSTVDDSGFLGRVIAALVAARTVDPSRVYVVGHSNGGFMALRMACEHADQVAAVASLAGAMDADAAACAPVRPVAVLQVHGDADDTILYDGGDIDGVPYSSAVETVARWRQLDDCPGDGREAAPQDADATLPGEDLTPTEWPGCRADTAVALWTIAGGRHVPTFTPGFSGSLLDWLEKHGRRP